VWRIHRVETTGSTNADVAAAAAAREPEGFVLIADQQTQGRGRLGRPWTSPPGSSLSVSVLLRPFEVAAASWPWLPLLVGVAAVEAVRDAAGVDARLKWPNDVLLDGGKLAGILVERIETADGPAAVAGVGMNITSAPVPELTAASLAETSATRDAVLTALLDRLATHYGQWRADPAGSALIEKYRQLCDTIGLDVRVELPGGATVAGRAAGVDTSGGLVVATGDGHEVVSAGDVVHVRPGQPSLSVDMTIDGM
jgi:BirA family biotin operon repressor/biotin-[acetyl-CoA-carboxylase] ligase